MALSSTVQSQHTGALPGQASNARSPPAAGVPDRKDGELVILDAVVDEIPNTIEMQAARSDEATTGDLGTHAGSAKEHRERGLKILSKRGRSREPVVAPPSISSSNLGCRSCGDT